MLLHKLDLGANVDLIRRGSLHFLERLSPRFGKMRLKLWHTSAEGCPLTKRLNSLLPEVVCADERSSGLQRFCVRHKAFSARAKGCFCIL